MKKEIATLQSKENAWSKTRPYEVDEGFRWLTMDCRLLRPCEMATSHLFNSVKMMWNHMLPKQFQILPFTEYKGVYQWTKGETRIAIKNLLHELMNRSDRTEGMNDALRRMMQHLSQVDRLLKS